MTSAAPSSTVPLPLLSATPIPCASFLEISVRLTNIIVIFVGQDEDARFMDTQVLLAKSLPSSPKCRRTKWDRTREKHAAVAVATRRTAQRKRKPKQRARQSGPRASGRGKRTRVESDDERDAEDDGEEPPKRVKVLANDAKPAFLQPALVTGATLKDYQLEGVAWMVSLWENGISGILGESL